MQHFNTSGNDSVATSLSLEAALAYTRRGWRVIPVPYGEKNPGFTGWEDLRLDQHDLPQRFIDGENIGALLGEPSGGLIDTDLDVPQAVRLASKFLPATACIFGRSSCPRSHWLFLVTGVLSTEQFRDPIDKAMLVELRSTGAQTIVPPSTLTEHNDEVVAFDENGDPAGVDAEALRRAVRKLAAATLLARHWPREGSRHAVSMALHGGLERSGWSSDEAGHFVGAVAEAAGDEEVRDRIASARSTKQRLTDGKTATGWTTLAKLLDAKVVDRAREWLDLVSPGAQCDVAGPGRVSQATELVELALEQAEFFHAPDDTTFATVPVASHRETWATRSKGFRRWLFGQFYERTGKAPGGQAVSDALGVLEGRAAFGGEMSPVWTRIAEVDGVLYLDLGDAAWRAVEISEAGWRVISDPPVRFRRSRGMAPLPVPVRGGSLRALRRYVNIPSDTDWQLYIGWLLGALRFRGPFPVLAIHGEQGSAKSTVTRVTRALIDPNTAPLRSEPREVRDVMIAANNSWIQSFDNLSHLPKWFSDCLCRLATGGGFATRQLYEDAEEVLFDAQRPVILNGIEELATRGDLLDRALMLYLPTIPDKQRLQEDLFWSTFEADRPALLGALLDATVVALRNLHRTRLESLPRMADFALWVTAAESVLPWTRARGTFVNAYMGNRESANELTLEAAVIAPGIRALAEETDAGWTGTAADLLKRLGEQVEEDVRRQKGWPKAPNALTNALRRIVPNLRRVGIEVEFGREGHTRARLVKVCKTSSAPSAAPEPVENKGVECGRSFRDTIEQTSSAPSAESSAIAETAQSMPFGEGGADDLSDPRTMCGRSPSSAAKSCSTRVAGNADDADDLFPHSSNPGNRALHPTPDVTGEVDI